MEDEQVTRPSNLLADVSSQGRLTVVETVYYQRMDGSDPVSAEARFAVDYPQGDQVVSRTYVLKGNWLPLSGFWPERIGMLVIGVKVSVTSRMPTAEEREELAGRRVLVAFSDGPQEEGVRTQHSPPRQAFAPAPSMDVGPGESCRFRPLDLKRVWLKSTAPDVTVVVTAFPG